MTPAALQVAATAGMVRAKVKGNIGTTGTMEATTADLTIGVAVEVGALQALLPLLRHRRRRPATSCVDLHLPPLLHAVCLSASREALHPHRPANTPCGADGAVHRRT